MPYVLQKLHVTAPVSIRVKSGIVHVLSRSLGYGSLTVVTTMIIVQL